MFKRHSLFPNKVKTIPRSLANWIFADQLSSSGWIVVPTKTTADGRRVSESTRTARRNESSKSNEPWRNGTITFWVLPTSRWTMRSDIPRIASLPNGLSKTSSVGIICRQKNRRRKRKAWTLWSGSCFRSSQSSISGRYSNPRTSLERNSSLEAKSLFPFSPRGITKASNCIKCGESQRKR